MAYGFGEYSKTPRPSTLGCMLLLGVSRNSATPEALMTRVICLFRDNAPPHLRNSQRHVFFPRGSAIKHVAT